METSAKIEALLFASGEPMLKERLASLLGISKSEVLVELTKLREALSRRGIALVESNESVELRTAPEAVEIIKIFRSSELSRELGRAGLETLAAVLYQGNPTRGDIDYIRGVNSSTTLRTLLMRGLVERVEDSKDARRFRYQATTEALAHLGITSLEELPRYTELKNEASQTLAVSTHE